MQININDNNITNCMCLNPIRNFPSLANLINVDDRKEFDCLF